MLGNFNDVNAPGYKNKSAKQTHVALATLDLDSYVKHIKKHNVGMTRICEMFSLIDSHSCKIIKSPFPLHKLH